MTSSNESISQPLSWPERLKNLGNSCWDWVKVYGPGVVAAYIYNVVDKWANRVGAALFQEWLENGLADVMGDVIKNINGVALASQFTIVAVFLVVGGIVTHPDHVRWSRQLVIPFTAVASTVFVLPVLLPAAPYVVIGLEILAIAAAVGITWWLDNELRASRGRTAMLTLAFLTCVAAGQLNPPFAPRTRRSERARVVTPQPKQSIKTAPTPMLPTQPTTRPSSNPTPAATPGLLPTPTLRPTATLTTGATPTATPTPQSSGRNCPAMPFPPTPPAATYTVVSGDSLAKIAARYQTTAAALVAANMAYYPTLVDRPDCIRTGWQLIVP